MRCVRAQFVANALGCGWLRGNHNQPLLMRGVDRNICRICTKRPPSSPGLAAEVSPATLAKRRRQYRNNRVDHRWTRDNSGHFGTFQATDTLLRGDQPRKMVCPKLTDKSALVGWAVPVVILPAPAAVESDGLGRGVASSRIGPAYKPGLVL